MAAETPDRIVVTGDNLRGLAHPLRVRLLGLLRTYGPATATSLAANTTPSGPAAWKSVPSWAVIGTEDRVIPPATQRSMAERAGATITEAPGSHVSMVSHPQVTIDAILAAAGS